MASSQRSNHRQPLILEAANTQEVNKEGSAMEIIIRRVGMEDHINIVKLFQVSATMLQTISKGEINAKKE